MTEQEQAAEIVARLERAAWKGFNQTDSEFEKGYKHAMGVAAQAVRELFGMEPPLLKPSEKKKNA